MAIKVLIVEDEPLLAMALSDQLADCGFDIAGIASTAERGVALLQSVGCDVAILDCNLRGRSVDPLADALHAKGIPFLFHSGYNGQQLAERYGDVPFLAKPVSSDKLVATIKALAAGNP